ncbi:MAG TPA: NAD(P)/FAD-dependent oxidoreductase [Bacteroidota bacterium]|nr:NAD(P)/FAD-dependent oxidoreductase [Bacteroidota bacterium]
MPDVIILGAGAAGLMCAIEAGKRGRSVLVLERNERIGEKIRISGGGRCNFTNRVTEHEHYISENPHFCKSALARLTPDAIIAMVEKHGIAYHEKTLGQLFCDRSSLQIIDMLQKECNKAGVKVEVNSHVSGVRKSDRFVVTTQTGEIESGSLVIATGGLSIPKLGATDLGYRLANQFGLNITHTSPGLVPVTLSDEDVTFFNGLSGVSVDAVTRCNGQSFRENILFTHRGLSGPGILQISSYWKPGNAISIDLSPDVDLRKFLTEQHLSDAEIPSVLSELLPRRFAKKMCERYGWSKPLHHYSSVELSSIAAQLHDWKLEPEGTEGYSKAEVTCGGVDTKGLSSKTMEARNVPGLFVIGEVVDVTGHLGGYNFQWAWASGFVAGQAA